MRISDWSSDVCSSDLGMTIRNRFRNSFWGAGSSQMYIFASRFEENIAAFAAAASSGRRSMRTATVRLGPVRLGRSAAGVWTMVRSTLSVAWAPDAERPMKNLYTTKESALGGRAGQAKSEDGVLDVDLTEREEGRVGTEVDSKGE